MYKLFELELRGGVSKISKKFSAANHPDIEINDPNKSIKNIVYLDESPSYWKLWSYQKSHLFGFLRWLMKEEIDNFDVMQVRTDGRIGYTLEVDWSYPAELHDSHNCYP